MNDDGVVITVEFSQELDDVFGKLVVAPTVRAQKLWELWRKNPTMFTLAPGYLEDTTTGELQLMELSLIPKVRSDEPKSD